MPKIRCGPADPPAYAGPCGLPVVDQTLGEPVDQPVLSLCRLQQVRNPTEAAYARSDLLIERRRRLMDDWATYLTVDPWTVEQLYAELRQSVRPSESRIMTRQR